MILTLPRRGSATQKAAKNRNVSGRKKLIQGEPEKKPGTKCQRVGKNSGIAPPLKEPIPSDANIQTHNCCLLNPPHLNAYKFWANVLVTLSAGHIFYLDEGNESFE